MSVSLHGEARRGGSSMQDWTGTMDWNAAEEENLKYLLLSCWQTSRLPTALGEFHQSLVHKGKHIHT